MVRPEVIEEIQNTIDSYLEERQFYLVEMKYFYQADTLVLVILADRPHGGITLKECIELNKSISIILDEKDILQERFILEVSSPGLDRPLVRKEDFLRCSNKEVRFFLNEPINEKMELQGTISKVEDDAVYIAMQEEIFKVPLIRIIRAKQIVI
jgi:ribosome maturation factor RimP